MRRVEPARLLRVFRNARGRLQTPPRPRRAPLGAGRRRPPASTRTPFQPLAPTGRPVIRAGPPPLGPRGPAPELCCCNARAAPGARRTRPNLGQPFPAPCARPAPALPSRRWSYPARPPRGNSGKKPPRRRPPKRPAPPWRNRRKRVPPLSRAGPAPPPRPAPAPPPRSVPPGMVPASRGPPPRRFRPLAATPP